MEFEWDEARRAANLVKHGLDFADAARMEWADATILPDQRFDYGEDRFFAFAEWGGELHMIAFTWRANVLRVVSFRPANRKERRLYG